MIFFKMVYGKEEENLNRWLEQPGKLTLENCMKKLSNHSINNKLE